MPTWCWGLGLLLLGMIGWPSTRVQATALAGAKWGLRLGLGAAVLAGLALSLAPERVQLLAPTVETVAARTGDVWHALPRGGQWLLVAIGLMLAGLPLIALLDFARDLTLLHGPTPRRVLREAVLPPPPATSTNTSTPYDVETALNAFRGPGPTSTGSKRPLHEALGRP